jgi:hypothetical protein
MLMEILTRQCMQQLNYILPTVRLYWIDGHKFEVMHHSSSSSMLGIQYIPQRLDTRHDLDLISTSAHGVMFMACA